MHFSVVSPCFGDIMYLSEREKGNEMQTRTSKKQMREAEKSLKAMFENDAIWAAGERDATSKAYIRHNGEITEYENNTEAYFAAAEIIFAADEI